VARYVTVCCSVLLQCVVAVCCCSVLNCVAKHCSVLQCVAVCCRAPDMCRVILSRNSRGIVFFSVLKCVAVCCCSMLLQRVAVCGSVLQGPRHI